MAQYKDTYLLNPNGSLFRTVGLPATPIKVWEVDNDGKRKQTDRQEHRNGVPVWEMEVMVQKMNYGAPVAELIKLRYASVDGKLPGKDLFFDTEGLEDNGMFQDDEDVK